MIDGEGEIGTLVIAAKNPSAASWLAIRIWRAGPLECPVDERGEFSLLATRRGLSGSLW